MPTGYSFAWDPNEIAAAVLRKSSWAVLALTLHIELFTQAHYRESIHRDAALSPLSKDIFLFHWKEESQHAIIDELEWRRVNDALSDADRDRAVDEFCELVEAVDAIAQAQTGADAAYFTATCGRRLNASEQGMVRQTLLDAYRWQYIVSGIRHPHFAATLAGMTTEAQRERIGQALAFLEPAPAPLPHAA
jgi:hypothetical protein